MANSPKKDAGSALQRQDRSGSPSDRVVTVLAINPLQEDQAFLRNIFSHSNWRLSTVGSWQEARSLLNHGGMPVVITDAVLHDADWKDILAELERLPDPPLLVVSARSADDRLWAEVLNLGGYDVLAKPFDATEVYRVVSLAWLNWKHAREGRQSGFELERAVGM